MTSIPLSDIANIKLIYKTKHFARWARKAGLDDTLLERAVTEISHGLLDADLGGGLIKKRVPLPGKGKSGSYRTLLVTNRNDRCFFVFGFQKNERENISEPDLIALKKLAKDLLSLSEAQIAVAIGERALVEVKYEK